MTLDEAQNVAFRLANLRSDAVTLKEIKAALVCLANFYEDNKHNNVDKQEGQMIPKDKEIELALNDKREIIEE